MVAFFSSFFVECDQTAVELTEGMFVSQRQGKMDRRETLVGQKDTQCPETRLFFFLQRDGGGGGGMTLVEDDIPWSNQRGTNFKKKNDHFLVRYLPNKNERATESST